MDWAKQMAIVSMKTASRHRATGRLSSSACKTILRKASNHWKDTAVPGSKKRKRSAKKALTSSGRRSARKARNSGSAGTRRGAQTPSMRFYGWGGDRKSRDFQAHKMIQYWAKQLATEALQAEA